MTVYYKFYISWGRCNLIYADHVSLSYTRQLRDKMINTIKRK